MRKITLASSLALTLLATPFLAQTAHAQSSGADIMSGTSTTAPKTITPGDSGVNTSNLKSATSKKEAEIRAAPPGAVGSGVSNKPSATTPTDAAQ